MHKNVIAEMWRKRDVLAPSLYRGTLVLMSSEHTEHEALVASLMSGESFEAYKKPYDHYRTSFLPRLFGDFFVGCGNLVYGKRPSYLKFRAIEVIARIPYQSWSSAIFTLLTLFYADEARALRLSRITRFTRFAADNETMHVVVVSMLAKKHAHAGFVRHTLIPIVFSFVYFWIAYLMYLIHPRWSLELNYLFEQHAFNQYREFVAVHEKPLRSHALSSDFLAWYGRTAHSEYDFFLSVRNDELVHRNRSIHEIEMHANKIHNEEPASY